MLTQTQSVFDKCPLKDQGAIKTFNKKGKVIIKDRDGKF